MPIAVQTPAGETYDIPTGDTPCEPLRDAATATCTCDHSPVAPRSDTTEGEL